MENIEICQSITGQLKDLILNKNLVIDKDFIKKAYSEIFNGVKGKILIKKYDTINNGIYLIKFGETIFDNVETLLLKTDDSTIYPPQKYSCDITYNLYEGFYRFDYVRNYELYKNHIETTEEVWKKYYDKYLKIKEVFEKELR